LKLPRDLSGAELAAALRKFGYKVVRQTGSHIRLVAQIHGREHHITIPAHATLKTGTLNGILTDVASHLEISKAELIQSLFE